MLQCPPYHTHTHTLPLLDWTADTVEAVGKRYGPGMDLAPYTTKLTESAQAAQALAKVAAAGAARL